MSHSGMSKGTAKEYFKSLKSEQVGVPCNATKSCDPFSNITVQIVVLQESSGNRQIVLRTIGVQILKSLQGRNYKNSVPFRNLK